MARKNLQSFLFCLLAVFAFASCLFVLTPSASAQTVILSPPAGAPLGSGYGPRGAPCASCSSNHKGQDLPLASGTSFSYEGTLLGCQEQRGGNGQLTGWGVYARVDRGCCVQELFAHLESCGAGGLRSDTTGSATGAHVHWEVILKGVKVDPAFAMGKNLCDPTIQDQVIAHAYSIYSPSQIGGGGGSSGACSAPPPPQQPVEEKEFVPTGGTNPETGAVNTGPPLLITRTTDGRTIVEVAPNFFDTVGTLPPSVTTGFTQPATTNNPVTGCATDTWTAMVNQSVLQSRREMAINQRYIAKADSVLAYACLGIPIEAAGNNIGPIFSESTQWANKQIDIIGDTVTTSVNMGAGSLDGALGNAANSLAENYLNNSFYHNYMGGTAGQTAMPTPGGGGGGGSDADFGQLQTTGTCGLMSQVWSISKCQNVTDSIMFPRFEDLIGTDPRVYPQIYTCRDSGISQGMIDTARGAGVAMSPMESHAAILNPALVGGSGCAPPIPTGVTIERRFGLGRISVPRNYVDAICPTPGCTYQNPSLGGLGTCQ